MEQRKFFVHPLIKKNAIEKRLYQEIIAASALRGNTMVILPTGLGKTIIAVLIAAARLAQFQDSKVVILAPTRPLVEQHRETFKEMLNVPDDKLIVLTGSKSPKQRFELWKKARVAFMTPQTLQNDLTAGRYTLRDVVLLVFDECHRAVGEYPYVYIAKRYMNDAEHPLILGITASPGSSDEEIKEIIENLYIENIEIRDERSPDVRPYVQKREIHWHRIELPEEFYRILKLIGDKLKEILRELKEHGYVNSTDIRNVKRTDLIEIKAKIQEELSREVLPTSSHYGILMKVANAIRLSYLMELLETQGLSSFYKYLQKIEKEASRPGGTRAVKELVYSEFFSEIKALARILLDKNIEHPKINALISILKDFIEKNPNSRILVFTHFRVTAQLVADVLNKNGFSATWFVGQQKRGTVEGMTQKTQIETLKKFSSGEIQILVATSVAEEGIDISECDLVVFYDNVPSAIRRIQRMGRTGRKRKGHIIVLIAKGTRDEGYYWASHHREQKMKQVLKDLKRELNKNKRGVNKLDLGQTQLDAFLSMKKKEKDRETEAQIIKIIVDSREGNSQVVKELSLMPNVKLELTNLDCGDFVVSDRVGIERKEAKDFVTSIIDGRLFKQIKDLSSVYPKPILLIEGFDIFAVSGVNPNAIRGALASIVTDFNIPIIWSRNGKESALLIYAIANREQRELKRCVVIRSTKAPLLTYEIQEYILAGIPFIDRRRAKALLMHFKTLQNIFNAPEEELANIPGIGPKIAKKIREIATAIYSPEGEEKNR